ncbi:MAG: YgjV family protein [Erysipelotrichaceae bacterium]|uniref:YgjV family protein n=1 Tax=Floccifex sp. TaxID=2815810 RepID=UPI002A760FC1|nr:YgjV family protein [Floccifex sp.]MDD7280691.1 YgjV family protein [Erysipelotrichaceae bacterium]MDY2957593.1 YgjV family protein [Floccifex sp.]
MNFNTFFIGNAIALLGSFVMIGIGFLKKKEHILIGQCFQCGLIGISQLILGGITGFITNSFTILRNLLSFKIPFTKPVKIVFILIQIVLALNFDSITLINMLPIIATAIFTWYMDSKDPIQFKIVVIGTLLLWLIYDFSISNYVAFFFDCVSTCTNSYTFYKMKKSF